MKNRKWLRRQKQTFDCVLLDVPCSGTGTWRRNPDTRWRNYGPSVEELVVIQREIFGKSGRNSEIRRSFGVCHLLDFARRKRRTNHGVF